MKKYILIFIGLLVLTDACPESIGQTDNRVYVSDKEWKNYPYNLTVLMLNNSGDPKCTSQYGYTNLLITSDHCIDGTTATFRGPNGSFSGSLIARGNAVGPNGKMIDHKNDWAIYEIRDKNYFMPSNWFKVSPYSTTYYNQVQFAAFSDLRIINDMELNKIKSITIALLKNKSLSKDLSFEDEKTFETATASDVRFAPYTDFVNALNMELAKQKIPPLYGDGRRLKVDPSYSVVSLNYDHNQLGHNCDGSMGSSGAALIVRDGTNSFKIVGMQSRSNPTIGNKNKISTNINSYATQTEYFYPIIQKLIFDGKKTGL